MFETKDKYNLSVAPFKTNTRPDGLEFITLLQEVRLYQLFYYLSEGHCS